MIEYDIEEATLIYRCYFNRMLIHLPTIGTPVFNTLLRRLQPYEISPSGIMLESPTSKLSDVVLTIVLFEGRVQVRVTFAWTELHAKDFADNEVAVLFDIGDALFTALQEIDEEIGKGNVNITYRAHLSLAQKQSEQFLHKYLLSNLSDLTPNAFAYKIHLEQITNLKDMQIAFAKSQIFDNAIFIDMSAEYKIDGEPLEPAQRFEENLVSALGLFELKPTEIT